MKQLYLKHGNWQKAMKHRYKIEIEKNQGKGYTITIFLQENIKYEVYAETKKEANQWIKDNRDRIKMLSESLTGR